MKRYKVIALCGSSKFKDEILQEQVRLTLKGNVVIAPTMFDQTKDLCQVEKLALQLLNYQKIEMADELFVINKNGYIEESTRLEIQYAINLKKPVTYMEKETRYRKVV